MVTFQQEDNITLVENWSTDGIDGGGNIFSGTFFFLYDLMLSTFRFCADFCSYWPWLCWVAKSKNERFSFSLIITTNFMTDFIWKIQAKYVNVQMVCNNLRGLLAFQTSQGSHWKLINTFHLKWRELTRYCDLIEKISVKHTTKPTFLE